MRSPLVARLSSSIPIVAVMTVVLGVAYPLAGSALAQVVAEYRADGQVIELDGEVVGSRLIAQEFASVGYSQSRLSAGYDAAASTLSNVVPTVPELLDVVADRVGTYHEQNGVADGAPIPVDAVSASGSALDPRISRANAVRVALRVGEHTDLQASGIFGGDAVRVCVPKFNVALETVAGVS